MTSSWRSRAIRSRSSSRPATRACSWSRAFSIARPGGSGQSDRELLVDVGEHLTVGLVREVEVAVDDAAQSDRHAEERGHRRMPGREPEAVRMGVQVGEPQRFADRGSAARGCRDPPDARRCAASRSSSSPTVMNSARRDPDSSSTPKRRVLGVDQIGGRLGDAAQRVGEGLLGPDRHHRVEQPEQLLRSGELEATGHPREATTRRS